MLFSIRNPLNLFATEDASHHQDYYMLNLEGDPDYKVSMEVIDSRAFFKSWFISPIYRMNFNRLKYKGEGIKLLKYQQDIPANGGQFET